MFRFIHSSDLHLGKRFGNFSGDLPGRLREARHAVIGRLAQHARDQGASTVLLAGDTFDSETPAPDVRRQALAEMARHAPVRFVILPGNHDSLQASQLWTCLKSEAPANVTLVLEAEPLMLAPDVVLLPAPCTFRRPGRDLTEWMDAQASAEGVVRIGLAHGAIRHFSEEAIAAEIIAPDRARRAGLAYLALGDWHGSVEVDARTYYSGTPEPDRFKHSRPGEALAVSLASPAAPPQVTRLETGSFNWAMPELHLFDGEDPLPLAESLLPLPRDRRQSLVRMIASGRSRLSERDSLIRFIETAAPDFALLELDEAELATECEAEDLDQVDRAGALREAAEMLLAEARDEGAPVAEREIARAALARLYSHAQRIDP